MCVICEQASCAFEGGFEGASITAFSFTTTEDTSVAFDGSVRTPTTDDALALLSGYDWGETSIVSYGIADSSDDYVEGQSYFGEVDTFIAFSDAGEEILHAAVDEFTGILAVDIVQTDAPDATIVIGGSSVPSTAWAYLPAAAEYGGDIWFGLDTNYFDLLTDLETSPYLGSYEHFTALHEFGHALGLKHPHDIYGTNTTELSRDVDCLEFSVMSYRSYASAPLSGYTVSGAGYPQSLMMLDIAALQIMYGADYTTLSGDTVYTFDPLTGEMLVDGVPTGTPVDNVVFRTLWDGNGNDTIDLSNYNTDLDINLNAGSDIDLDVGGTAQRSLLGYDNGTGIYARAHVYMSLLFENNVSSLIENAKGGSGNDRLTGNQVSNLLEGGDGDDTLSGGEGADTLVLGAGSDIVADTIDGLNGDKIVDFNIQEDQLLLIDGNVAVLNAWYDSNIQSLQIDSDGDGTSDASLTLGLHDDHDVLIVENADGLAISLAKIDEDTTEDDTGVQDIATGNTAVNLLGSNASDLLVGSVQNDTFVMRFGSDTAVGGAGADQFILDGRYLKDGDSHIVVDLDFTEADKIILRYFDFLNTTITGLDDLVLLSTLDIVTTTKVAEGTVFSFSEAGKSTVSVQLNGVFLDDTLPQQALSLIGVWDAEYLIGGQGSDTITLRFGNDIAIGNDGADSFVIDWKTISVDTYVTIEDLDFDEGDTLSLLNFQGSSTTFSSEAELIAFIEKHDYVNGISGTSGNTIVMTDTDNVMLSIALPTIDSVEIEVPIELMGSFDDDVMIGNDADNKFLLRFGNDVAIGDDGADLFAVDGRYVLDGDSHQIKDLNFDEGDILLVRFFSTGPEYTLKSMQDVYDLADEDNYDLIMNGSSYTLQLTNDDGEVLSLYF